MQIPRKIFEVTVHNKQYVVYDIEGKEHEGYGDIPKTWWLYYATKLQEDLIPPADSPDFVPFSRSINRRLWDIRITQYNSSKYKWDETRFSTGTNVEMWCNGKLIYAFGTFEASFAFAKIQYLQIILSEHSYNFFEPEKENGRKICWYGLPATVKVKQSTWEIAIIPDYTAGINQEDWWKEYRRRKKNHSNDDTEDLKMDEMYDTEETNDGYINWGDALSDNHIYWHRK
jgi:hypothetical protein